MALLVVTVWAFVPAAELKVIVLLGLTVISKLTGVPVQPEPNMKLPKAIGLFPTAIVDATVFVLVLTIDILFEPELATYSLLPSGLRDNPLGLPPTPIVADTVLVAVLITDTLFVLILETYTLVPSVLTVTPLGLLPTAIVADTVWPTVFITDTLLEPLLTT